MHSQIGKSLIKGLKRSQSQISFLHLFLQWLLLCSFSPLLQMELPWLRKREAKLRRELMMMIPLTPRKAPPSPLSRNERKCPTTTPAHFLGHIPIMSLACSFSVSGGKRKRTENLGRTKQKIQWQKVSETIFVSLPEFSEIMKKYLAYSSYHMLWWSYLFSTKSNVEPYFTQTSTKLHTVWYMYISIWVFFSNTFAAFKFCCHCFCKRVVKLGMEVYGSVQLLNSDIEATLRLITTHQQSQTQKFSSNIHNRKREKYFPIQFKWSNWVEFSRNIQLGISETHACAYLSLAIENKF